MMTTIGVTLTKPLESAQATSVSSSELCGCLTHSRDSWRARRLQRAGDDQRPPQHHQRTDGDQRPVPETAKGVGGGGPVGKDGKADDQRNENQEGGGGRDRHPLPREQREGDDG